MWYICMSFYIKIAFEKVRLLIYLFCFTIYREKSECLSVGHLKRNKKRTNQSHSSWKVLTSTGYNVKRASLVYFFNRFGIWKVKIICLSTFHITFSLIFWYPWIPIYVSYAELLFPWFYTECQKMFHFLHYSFKVVKHGKNQINCEVIINLATKRHSGRII